MEVDLSLRLRKSSFLKHRISLYDHTWVEVILEAKTAPVFLCQLVNSDIRIAARVYGCL
jgi:hypothetical protein